MSCKDKCCTFFSLLVLLKSCGLIAYFFVNTILSYTKFYDIEYKLFDPNANKSIEYRFYYALKMDADPNKTSFSSCTKFYNPGHVVHAESFTLNKILVISQYWLYFLVLIIFGVVEISLKIKSMRDSNATYKELNVGLMFA